MNDQQQHSKESDIYSFGMILWEMASGEFAFEATITYSQMMRACNSANERILDDCEASVAQLIRWCWDERPVRPTVDEVIEVLDDCQGVTLA